MTDKDFFIYLWLIHNDPIINLPLLKEKEVIDVDDNNFYDIEVKYEEK